LTPKQRMLAAYRGELPDYTPVAPEFWYYVPAKVLGLDMITFEREVPHWEALLKTFDYYKTEGWGIAGPSIPTEGTSSSEEWIDIGVGRFESRVTTHTPLGDLRSSSVFDPVEPCWSVEHAIKDFDRDWPAYVHSTLGNPEEADWSGVNAALDKVGENYLLEVYSGWFFIDYIAGSRQGGIEQAIYDLYEREEYFEEFHKQFIDYIRRLVRSVFAGSKAESIFIGSCWSCPSLTGPNLWRKWEKPVLMAAAEEAHAAGGLLHVHLHGKVMDVLDELHETGIDCICPFERPPGGDVTDLSVVEKALHGKVTMNGNIHTVETLIRGSAQDVRDEIAEIFGQWGPDRRRLILGTGDQVGLETPDENIAAMIEAGREFGKNI